MVLEAIAARDYGRKIEKLSFCRSASGAEVELLIDDHTAVEFKTGTVDASDAKGIVAARRK